MSKEEQIALELTKLVENKNSLSVMANYEYFLKKLQKSDDIEVFDLKDDELWTYKHIAQEIKKMVDNSDAPFIAKKDLNELLGGIDYVEDDN